MPAFTIPDDASRHLLDLWELRERLWAELSDASMPSSVVVQVTKGLTDLDEKIAALCPGFTSEVVAPAGPGEDDLDEFTKRMQQAARRAG